MINDPKERPEWITCIESEQKWKSLCGRTDQGFMFTGAAHADNNKKQEGRLVTCPECQTEVLNL